MEQQVFHRFNVLGEDSHSISPFAMAMERRRPPAVPAVGGGFETAGSANSAIAHAEILLKAENFKVELSPMHRHPDEAGLIGA
jgi:hypothetical protein